MSKDVNLTNGEINRATSFIRKVTGNKNAVITAWSTCGKKDDFGRVEFRFEVCNGYDGYPEENWWNFYMMSDTEDRRRSYAYYWSDKMFYGQSTSKAKKQTLI